MVNKIAKTYSVKDGQVKKAVTSSTEEKLEEAIKALLELISSQSPEFSFSFPRSEPSYRDQLIETGFHGIGGIKYPTFVGVRSGDVKKEFDEAYDEDTIIIPVDPVIAIDPRIFDSSPVNYTNDPVGYRSSYRSDVADDKFSSHTAEPSYSDGSMETEKYSVLFTNGRFVIIEDRHSPVYYDSEIVF